MSNVQNISALARGQLHTHFSCLDFQSNRFFLGHGYFIFSRALHLQLRDALSRVANRAEREAGL